MKGKWSLAEALRANAVRLLSLIALLVAWSIIASFFDPTILPGPAIVLKEVYKIFSTGEFLVHMFATIRRVVIGFIWAFVFSVIIGLLMGLSRTCERFFEVEVLVGLTIPGMAWAMIAIMWFGIRDMAAIFAIFIIILPMITVNMWEGTKSIDKELVEMGQAFKAEPSFKVKLLLRCSMLIDRDNGQALLSSMMKGMRAAPQIVTVGRHRVTRSSMSFKRPNSTIIMMMVKEMVQASTPSMEKRVKLSLIL